MINTLAQAMQRYKMHTLYAGGPGSGRHPEGGSKPQDEGHMLRAKGRKLMVEGHKL